MCGLRVGALRIHLPVFTCLSTLDCLQAFSEQSNYIWFLFFCQSSVTQPFKCICACVSCSRCIWDKKQLPRVTNGLIVIDWAKQNMVCGTSNSSQGKACPACCSDAVHCSFARNQALLLKVMASLSLCIPLSLSLYIYINGYYEIMWSTKGNEKFRNYG